MEISILFFTMLLKLFSLKSKYGNLIKSPIYKCSVGLIIFVKSDTNLLFKTPINLYFSSIVLGK
ncbi:MAG TPA: hypothetical protein DCR90_01155 [Fusobacteriaceae bacterium]|nr:hypothetical protein [Fusobacteriaceae bacterium]